MPPAATKSNMAKISKSYILTPLRPQGHVMSLKCDEPIDELTVQVWLLYLHPNFKYCTLLVSGTELRTDRRTDGQTDKQTDDPITRCPRRTFQAGGIKRKFTKSSGCFRLGNFIYFLGKYRPFFHWDWGRIRPIWPPKQPSKITVRILVFKAQS